MRFRIPRVELAVVVAISLVAAATQVGARRSTRTNFTTNTGAAGAHSRDTGPRDASLTLQGMLELDGRRTMLEVAGHTAYVGGNSYDPFGLMIVDASNPSSPFVAGNYLGGTTEETRYVAAPKAIFGDLLVTELSIHTPNRPVSKHVQLLDVAAPLSPVVETTFDLQGTSSEVSAIFSPDGSMVHIAPLGVLNVANPASPQVVESALPFIKVSLWLDGLMVGRMPRGSDVQLDHLVGVGVTDFANPTIAFKELSLDVMGPDLHVNGSQLFLTEQGRDVSSIIALSNRSGRVPAVVGKYHSPGKSFPQLPPRLAGRGSLLILGCRGGRIDLVSFREPTRPVLLETTRLDVGIYDMVLQDDLLYVLCGEDGLMIFQLVSVM